MTQRYTGSIALGRLAAGTCPECGFPVDQHDGAGGPMWCTLTDGGVTDRLAAYRDDQEGTTT